MQELEFPLIQLIYVENTLGPWRLAQQNESCAARDPLDIVGCQWEGLLDVLYDLWSVRSVHFKFKCL